jgi:hypothetical protein
VDDVVCYGGLCFITSMVLLQGGDLERASSMFRGYIFQINGKYFIIVWVLHVIGNMSLVLAMLSGGSSKLRGGLHYGP